MLILTSLWGRWFNWHHVVPVHPKRRRSHGDAVAQLNVKRVCRRSVCVHAEKDAGRWQQKPERAHAAAHRAAEV